MTRPIPLAIAWQLWCRHRWGIVTVLGVVLLMVASIPPLRGAAQLVWPGLSDEMLVTFAFILTTSLFTYVMTIFLLADAKAGSIGAGFPPRMFTLPVKTAELVAWPMLFGTATIAALWLIVATLVFRRCGFHPPLVLPALGMASLLAWLLALSWTPFRFPWLGVLVSALVIVAQFGAIVWLGVIVRVPMIGLIAIEIGSIATAYVVACVGVARDRRGDGRNAPAWWVRFRLSLDRHPHWREPFPSPGRAQLAYEWRNIGLALPLVTALNLAIIAVAFAFGHRLEYSSFRLILSISVVVPLIMAGPVGVNLIQWKPILDPRPACFTFVVTRPATSGSLVAAKFRVAALSILATYALILTVLPAIALLTGYSEHLSRMGRDYFERYPGPKGLAILALGGVAVLVVAWKQMTSGLAAGLSGERWRTLLGVGMFLLSFWILLGSGTWLSLHPEHWGTVLKAVPWLVGLAAVVKGLAALRAFPKAHRRGILTARDIGGILVVWLVVVAGMEVLVYLLRPAGGFAVPMAAVLVGVALTVPLVRLASAPLALDRNRHG